MSSIPIQINEQLISIYKVIFPEIINDLTNICQITHKMNGIFGEKANWRGIQIEKKIVAFCTFGFFNDQILFVYNIGVDPNWRKLGYASQIMRDLINEYNTKDIYLFVNKNNRPAIFLYRKFHFEYIDDAFVPPKGEICLYRSSIVKLIH